MFSPYRDLLFYFLFLFWKEKYVILGNYLEMSNGDSCFRPFGNSSLGDFQFFLEVLGLMFFFMGNGEMLVI
jgi:hypothetical protein